VSSIPGIVLICLCLPLQFYAGFQVSKKSVVRNEYTSKRVNLLKVSK
jgi:hypothetical protein